METAIKRRKTLLQFAAAALGAVLNGSSCRSLDPTAPTGPTSRRTSSGGTSSSRKAAAQSEFQKGFIASGASFRFAPHAAHGRPWTNSLQAGYNRFKTDSRVAFAVQNLDSGKYLAEQRADEVMFGGSMPKPAVSATLLELRQGKLSRDEFMHIVKVCDRSINASWKALLPLFTHADEQAFERKYGLPDIGIRSNHQSPAILLRVFSASGELSLRLWLRAAARSDASRPVRTWTLVPASRNFLCWRQNRHLRRVETRGAVFFATKGATFRSSSIPGDTSVAVRTTGAWGPCLAACFENTSLEPRLVSHCRSGPGRPSSMA